MNPNTGFQGPAVQTEEEVGLWKWHSKNTFLPQKWPQVENFKNLHPFVCEDHPQEGVCRVSGSSVENCGRSREISENALFAPKMRVGMKNSKIWIHLFVRTIPKKVCAKFQEARSRIVGGVAIWNQMLTPHRHTHTHTQTDRYRITLTTWDEISLWG